MNESTYEQNLFKGLEIVNNSMLESRYEINELAYQVATEELKLQEKIGLAYGADEVKGKTESARQAMLIARFYEDYEKIEKLKREITDLKAVLACDEGTSKLIVWRLRVLVESGD